MRHAGQASDYEPLSHWSPWQVLSLPQAKHGDKSSSCPVSCFNSALSLLCKSWPSRWYTHLPAGLGGDGGRV